MQTSVNTSPPEERRSLLGLFADLWHEASALIRAEAALASAEMSEKASAAGSAAGYIAVGGAALFAGFLVLLIAAAAGLAMVLPPEYAPWLAPLIVGAIVIVIGAVVLRGGQQRLKKAARLAPKRTLESLRRDGRMIKEHLT